MLKFPIWKAKKFTFLFSLQYMLSSLWVRLKVRIERHDMIH